MEARGNHNQVQKPEPILLLPLSPGAASAEVATKGQKHNWEESSLRDLALNPTILPAHQPQTNFTY